MSSYNSVTLVGNLTRDPEGRQTTGGMQVTKFSLAVNRKTKAGNETDYIDIVAWDKLGDICAKYLTRGSSVLIEGRLSIRSYEDKNGQKRQAAEVVANNMQMLGGAKQAEKPPGAFPAADNDSLF